jgi:hemin uptake protein HemP
MNAQAPAGTFLSEASPLHEATVLTQGGATARIHLNGQIYSLRITRQGKLILTK